MKFAETTFRWLGRGILLFTILLAPWCLGGVYPITQYWLTIGVTAALGCAAVAELFAPSSRWRIPGIVLPAVVALGIGLFQLLPLEPPLRQTISPWIAHWDATLTAEESDTDRKVREFLELPPLAERQPISANPAATRYGLAYFSMALGALVGGIFLFRRKRSLILLITAVSINGGAVSLFAIIQKLTWNGRIYWMLQSPGDESFSMGPFINRNNASGFLLICLGCSLGWLLYSLNQSHVMRLEKKAATRRPRHFGFFDRLSMMHPGHFALILLFGGIAGGILSSVSRGGSLSMCLAIATVAAVLALITRKAFWSTVMLVMFAGGIFLLFWIDWDQQLGERLETMTQSDILQEDNNLRLLNWSDALHVVPESPYVGSGLMTYEYVYRPYQDVYIFRRFAHAENFYVQTLVETGYFGFSMLIVGLILMFTYLIRLMRSSESWHKVLGIAGLFVLVSQMSASMFDFGLHLPANLLTLSVLVGGIASLSLNIDSRSRNASSGEPLDRVAWLCRALFPVAILTLCVFAVRELDQKAAADRARRQARSVTRAIEKSAEANFESDDPVTDQEIENALEGIEHALKQRPDDVWLHIHAAKLRMEQYRRAELQENIAPQGGMPQTGPTPLTIFHWSQLYHQYGLEEPLDQLRKNANVQKYVVPAMRHAILARRACPFLEMPHHLIAQLVGLVGSPQEYRRHLDRAILAYPSDPDVHLLSGILQYAVGDIIQAVEHWRASLRQSTVHREQILQLADPQGQAVPEFLDRLFPDDPHLLLGLAIGHYRENQEAKEHLLHRAAKALRETERIPPAEKQYMFGRIQWYLGQYEEALEHHKNALLLSPGQTQWRYVYALRLRERGRTTDALRQAKLCIRDKPSNTRYRRLHRELTREALLATPEEEESHEAETTP